MTDSYSIVSNHICNNCNLNLDPISPTISQKAPTFSVIMNGRSLTAASKSPNTRPPGCWGVSQPLSYLGEMKRYLTPSLMTESPTWLVKEAPGSSAAESLQGGVWGQVKWISAEWQRGRSTVVGPTSNLRSDAHLPNTLILYISLSTSRTSLPTLPTDN